jgi:RNA polymerase primary sigma factor
MKSTTLDDDVMNAYIHSIERYPLLSRDEEVAKFRAYRQDPENIELRNELVNANLRFVIYIAKKYTHLTLNDRVQLGNLGLIRAVEKYDPENAQGAKFVSYATWWIRQSIMNGITNTSREIRLPMNTAHIESRMKKYITDYFDENGREPSTKEVAKRFDVEESFVLDIYRTQGLSSLDSPVSDDSNIGDFVEDPSYQAEDLFDAYQASEDFIKYFIPRLNEKEREVFKQRVLLYPFEHSEHSLKNIGDTFHLSKERIRQIEGKVRRKMSAFMHEYYQGNKGEVDERLYQEFIDSSEVLQNVLGHH